MMGICFPGSTVQGDVAVGVRKPCSGGNTNDIPADSSQAVLSFRVRSVNDLTPEHFTAVCMDIAKTNVALSSLIS